MTSIATATARQRRKNGAVASPRWQTPLPLATQKRAAATKAGTPPGAAACLSLLCAMLFLGSLLSAVLHSALPVAEETSMFRRRRHAPRAPRSRGEGRGRREAPLPVPYVDVPAAASSSRRHDVIVVGCGPAGLSAALFASRMGMSVLVFGSPSAGSLSGTSSLDNFPSFLGRGDGDGGGGGGQGWIDDAMEQASSFGARFAPPAYVATGLAKVEVRGRVAFEVRVSTEASTDFKVLGRAVVVASGSVPRRLDLARESSLWGHSIHNCALCDGDAYVRNNAKKSVAVIGGGDAAVEAVFLLHKLGVDTIHWIHRREEYRANSLEVERVRRLPNVQVWTPYVVVEWMVKEEGESGTKEYPSPRMTLEGVRIVGAKNGAADPEATSSLTIPCDGAFLMIGSTPNSMWTQSSKSSGVNIDPVTKLILLPPSADVSSSDNNESVPIPQFSTSTSIEGGVFAAGEVVDGVYRQALTASSEGAKAAIDVQRYLHHLGIESSEPTRTIHSAVDRGNGMDKQTENMAKQNESSEKKEAVGVMPVDCDLRTLDCIESVVSTHSVVVFSKNYCPHCRRALEALRTLTEPLVIELTEIKDRMQVQKSLESMTGRFTVPNVFIGGKSIGGGDETVALFRSGKLGGLLLKATNQLKP